MNEKNASFFGHTSYSEKIRILDGRVVGFSTKKPFSIRGDINTHRWDLRWLNRRNRWAQPMQQVMRNMLVTHSLSYSNLIARAAFLLFKNSDLQNSNQITLLDISNAIPEKIRISYWPFISALLKRMANIEPKNTLSEDLQRFLKQPVNWETKDKGAYFALITNDPEHGAFTEQELLNIQEQTNQAYERKLISLKEYALVWFHIGTGVRPIQIARMVVEDVKIYDGPEGKELTLFIPLAKGEGQPTQGKWKRRCPTILAEILLRYLGRRPFLALRTTPNHAIKTAIEGQDGGGFANRW